MIEPKLRNLASHASQVELSPNDKDKIWSTLQSEMSMTAKRRFLKNRRSLLQNVSVIVVGLGLLIGGALYLPRDSVSKVSQPPAKVFVPTSSMYKFANWDVAVTRETIHQYKIAYYYTGTKKAEVVELDYASTRCTYMPPQPASRDSGLAAAAQTVTLPNGIGSYQADLIWKQGSATRTWHVPLTGASTPLQTKVVTKHASSQDWRADLTAQQVVGDGLIGSHDFTLTLSYTGESPVREKVQAIVHVNTGEVIVTPDLFHNGTTTLNFGLPGTLALSGVRGVTVSYGTHKETLLFHW